ncbi:MAG TPA: hypothetical protein VG028_04205 [Terriglobia bacterium]|nr:hypothetical protein [Terriglobia bacterium]
MKLRLKREPIIDNLRNHPAEMVEKLRSLLLTGAPANPDPHRRDFYEIENCSTIYYIHLSPLNSKVMFLAAWDKDGCEETVTEEVSPEVLACCGTC